ncbi:hypothetical protein ABEB36_004462 [Hypothenemus hampei]|uniref:Prostaglandin reductase 1 n=1 Tax=Hypothenemus hampei TaxID=57062 RepID=A0ABD1F3F1_HYPHA
MVKAKRFILVKRFVGFPKPTDLKLVEEELPPIKDGEFLAEAIYLSVDPYLRKKVSSFPVGDTMVGTQVAKIIESKNPKFPVGKHVVGQAGFGWRTHTISNGELTAEGLNSAVLIDLADLPLSLALGILGMPGYSAYFGFLEMLQPKAGEWLVISGAAGAVGNVVGQLAKIKGLKVIGIAGSDEKGKWLKKELGFDHFINYKTQDVGAELQRIVPEGVELYFDNVGGDVSTAVMNNMKTFGRITSCGSISNYNDTELKVVPLQHALVSRQLKMRGFQIVSLANRWNEAFKQNLEWIQQGKLKYRETITEGFHNMFNAFIDMLNGRNFGKAIVKV